MNNEEEKYKWHIKVAEKVWAIKDKVEELTIKEKETSIHR